MDRLIRSYSRLAVSSALKYKKFGLPVSDLIQEANVGLMQAADKFDPDRDVRFSTYSLGGSKPLSKNTFYETGPWFA